VNVAGAVMAKTAGQSPWNAAPGASAQPHTIENMVLTSFRYYLPTEDSKVEK
jgi:hypothetical protein